MKKLFFALILLIASVAAALWLRERDGFVIVQVGEWSVQASLVVFVAALVVLWLVIRVLFGLGGRVARAPGNMQAWLGRRRHDRARDELLKGLFLVAEGRYGDAERKLLSHVGAADVPVLHHLLAAIAAQRRGDWDARDEQLALADQSTPGAGVAVGLLQAQLQMDAEQWEQAHATLNWLRGEAPRNRRAVGLLAQCLLALEDWDRLWEMLPDLRRVGTISPQRLAMLEERVVAARMRRSAVAGGDELKALWQRLDQEQRDATGLRTIYLDALVDAGREGEAERLLLRWLRQDWEPALLRVWGRLGRVNGDRVLAQSERWLKQHPEDEYLLEAAGRQAMKRDLWGQARSYLEAAGARSHRADVQLVLAELYEQIDEPDRARAAYRRALGLEPERAGLPPIVPVVATF